MTTRRIQTFLKPRKEILLENEEKKVTEEKPQRLFVKSVLEFQSRLKYCEKIIVSLVFTNVLFALIIGVGIFENPLVIMEKDSEKLSFQSERREIGRASCRERV